MPEDSPASARVRASEIVAKISHQQPISEADTASLIEALAADLLTASGQARIDQDGLDE
jgi:hypothetical protein